MPVELFSRFGMPVLLSVGLAAANTSGRVLQTPRNDAGAFRPRAGAQRDIGLANCEVERAVVRDEIDDDVGIHTALPVVVYNNSQPKSPPSPVN